MLRNFKLAGITGPATSRDVRRIVLHQTLQAELARDWFEQLTQFQADREAIPFEPGYTLEDDEYFEISDFEAPAWLSDHSSSTIPNCTLMDRDATALEEVRGLAGFAKLQDDSEIVVIQNFTRGNIIRPGRLMILQSNTYQGVQDPGLRLDHKLAAVYLPAQQRLLFKSFQITNTFLSLASVFAEASEQQIRETLAHDRLAPENVDALAVDAPQWFRKRFAMLQANSVLDDFSPQQIQAKARSCDLTVRTSQGRVVFPSDRREAKKLLQFLNEELFRGPITNTLFATNSKREAGG